jgi:hypothetical protein
VDDALRSVWEPPTHAPMIRHVVVILQDGRSFDSYFGRYCRGPAVTDSSPPVNDDGRDGCEGMLSAPPDMLAGCTPLDPASDTHRPLASSACMRAKIDDGLMDNFAAPPSGDPLDVACAGVGAEAGALAAYQDLAARGALADRFFQSVAYVGASAPPPATPCVAGTGDSDIVTIYNLLYFEAARYAPELFFSLSDTPLLTIELKRQQVSWALYAGKNNLSRMMGYGVPHYYDSTWYPYRSLESGELGRDIDNGQLPPVALVVADASDPERGEAPGHPFANGIQFVTGIVDQIEGSVYADDTLVVLTYMTAGGYYDHVAPPPPPSALIDATDDARADTLGYGPRVPFLVLGRFAHHNGVSHVPLEMSSLTVFIEWNWLHSLTIKKGNIPGDLRQYRDTKANNIGSLLDAAVTGEPHVPFHRDD